MINIQKILIESCLAETEQAYRSLYGNLDERFLSVAQFAGRLALENIANCDALYHNLEHTIMVNSAGLAILKGKHLRDGGVSAQDWLHFNIATFCHDIGFVQGICRQDDDHVFTTGFDGDTVQFRTEGSDAQLGPWHVDRGKQFVKERYGNAGLWDIDADLICALIEQTRFPAVDPPEEEDGGNGLGGLVRAADLIGQLADPRYLHKIPALYYELMEIGKLDENQYQSPKQMRLEFADFFANAVEGHLSDALRYLAVTEEGRQWSASLYSHLYEVRKAVQTSKSGSELQDRQHG